MSYKINEIFRSLQGEGRFTGQAVIFIRFSGCNLKCGFCDTAHETFKEYKLHELMREIGQYKINRVVLTGGEPTLQVDAELLGALFQNGYKINMESNGTNLFDFKIDWLTISPKENWIQKHGDELKVVYVGQDLEQYFDSDFEYYYLQPCSMQNIPEVIAICETDQRWILSLQTQKMLNIR